MLFQFAALTDIGISRSIQQDNILVIPQLIHNNASRTDHLFFDDRNAALFAVADGMGGGAHGELASQMAIDGIREYILGHKDLLSSDTYTLINSAIYHANQRILDHLSAHPEDLSMGSTIIVGIVIDSVISLGWVGDSRCYALENGRIRQLSHDHSLVQSLVDDGSITEEEAFDHPNRNIINQSLGISSVIPSFEKMSLVGVDKLILCSDGLNSMLRDADIRDILSEEEPVEKVTRGLVDAANEAGGHDNISCIVVQLFPDDSMQTSIPAEPKTEYASIPKKRKIPWFLLIIGAGLIVAFVLVFQFQTRRIILPDKATTQPPSLIAEVTPDLPAPADSSEQSFVDGIYSVRLKVFSDSLKAGMFLDRLAGEESEKQFEIRRSSSGLFEVFLSGFTSKYAAQEYLSQGNYPDAVILFQKNVQ